jgi:Uncharacterized protein conserved in bacteria
MRKTLYFRLTTALLLVLTLTSFESKPNQTDERQPTLKLPYREAGLSEREAAAHLLDRFAFGARPGEVEKVVKMGLERWVEMQLHASLPSPKLTEKLAPLKTLTMSSAEILATYPNPGVLLAQAYRDGIISQADTAKENRAELRRKIMDYYQKEGVRPQRELISELRAQKILRAVYSENQLEEVLTDFWFNHFNVSITNNKAKGYVLLYERDAIRPNALGKFRELLGTTAKTPCHAALPRQCTIFRPRRRSDHTYTKPTALSAKSAHRTALGGSNRRTENGNASPAKRTA